MNVSGVVAVEFMKKRARGSDREVGRDDTSLKWHELGGIDGHSTSPQLKESARCLSSRRELDPRYRMRQRRKDLREVLQCPRRICVSHVIELSLVIPQDIELEVIHPCLLPGRNANGLGCSSRSTQASQDRRTEIFPKLRGSASRAAMQLYALKSCLHGTSDPTACW